MRRGQDIAVRHPGLYLVHHNLPGKEVALHSHPEHLLFIPLQGEIAVAVDGGAHALGPGRMLYLPPDTRHAFASSQAQGERLIAMLELRSWKAAGGGAHAASLMPASQLAKELLFYLLLSPETRHSRSLVNALIQTLSEGIEASAEARHAELAHLEGRATDPRVRKALELLRSGDGAASMEAIARKAGLSVRSLNRLVALELGVTPKQLLTQYRIARARELLLSGKHSVTEAALEVGYQSLSQFIASFRKITGQLPSEVARRA
jgi:AraC-like DNA-binding protein